jgi:hypothetical protein
MEKTMTTPDLPHTDSIKELAKFWDTHDLTDLEDQLEEVTEPVFERKEQAVMKIHLQPQEAESVKRLAESKGVAEETLIREWVVEKLRG